MKNLINYINPNLITLDDFDISIELDVDEKNEIIFPKNQEHSKMVVMTGDHAQERQKERRVSNKEIINTLFGAYKDISKLFADGKLGVTRSGVDNRFLIIDSRNGHGKKTICVVGFVANNHGTGKLKHPLFIIKTVYRGDDFAGAKRNDEVQNKIFLW